MAPKLFHFLNMSPQSRSNEMWAGASRYLQKEKGIARVTLETRTVLLLILFFFVFCICQCKVVGIPVRLLLLAAKSKRRRRAFRFPPLWNGFFSLSSTLLSGSTAVVQWAYTTARGGGGGVSNIPHTPLPIRTTFYTPPPPLLLLLLLVWEAQKPSFAMRSQIGPSNRQLLRFPQFFYKRSSFEFKFKFSKHEFKYFCANRLRVRRKLSASEAMECRPPPLYFA